MRRSKILEKIHRGQPVVVTHVWAVPHWKIVDMMGVVGFDGVWLEYEHSDFTLGELSQMILAARAHDMDSIVRVTREGYTSFVKPLEAGATGLVVPHCVNGEDARSIVNDTRFAPLGMRAVGGSVDAEYGAVDRAEYYEHANRETVVIVLIEDKEAVDSVDEIAATEGIDVLLVGPGDLSQSYGVRGQLDHELILKAIDATAAASEKHGKAWGTPAFSPEHLAELVGRGARFFEYGTDQSVLMEGLREIKDIIDGIEV